MKITCIHTADSNRILFDLAAGERGLLLSHIIRPDLLAATEHEGQLTAAIAKQTNQILSDALADSDAVVLTCSTLGPCVNQNPPVRKNLRIIRADGALAQATVQRPGELMVLYTAPTSRPATEAVFKAAAQSIGRRPATCRLVPDAWPAFKAGALDRYMHLIAQAADHAFAQGAQTIALAQASMAPARAIIQCPAAVLTVVDAAIDMAISLGSRS